MPQPGPHFRRIPRIGGLMNMSLCLIRSVSFVRPIEYMIYQYLNTYTKTPAPATSFRFYSGTYSSIFLKRFSSNIRIGNTVRLITSLGFVVMVILLIGLILPSNKISVLAQASYNSGELIESTPTNLSQQTDISQLIISEINYAGSYAQPCNDCAYDKWIELYNPHPATIQLNNYSLRFKDSTEANMNLALDGYEIAAYSYFLIANTRSGMVSQLSQAGITPHISSGKVLNVSNNQSKTIQISLLYNNETPVDSVFLGASLITSLESTSSGYKHSLERVNNSWQRAQSLYAPNNYGSPLAIRYTPPPKPVEIIPIPIANQLPVAANPKTVPQQIPQTITTTTPHTATIAEQITTSSLSQIQLSTAGDTFLLLPKLSHSHQLFHSLGEGNVQQTSPFNSETKITISRGERTQRVQTTPSDQLQFSDQLWFMALLGISSLRANKYRSKSEYSLWDEEFTVSNIHNNDLPLQLRISTITYPQFNPQLS